MSELVSFEGVTLDANAETRIVNAMLLPFDVEGSPITTKGSSVGTFGVDASSDIEFLEDPEMMTLNVEHDKYSPIGRGVSISAADNGIKASYRVAKGKAGDQALADIASGKRKHISMEARGVIVRAGKLIHATITGAGLVENPAFTGATIIASYGESETTDAAAADSENKTPDAPAETEAEMADAVVPETVLDAGAAPTKSDTTKRIEQLEAKLDAMSSPKRKGISPEQAFAGMVKVLNGEAIDASTRSQLFRSADSLFEEVRNLDAAQSNYASPDETQNLAPQWTGEYWGRVQPKALITDLLAPKTLTSRYVTGFKWSSLPTLGSWAGNGAEITSGAVTAVQPTQIPAQYAAGGNTISRENFDFGGGQAFLDEYFGFQSKNVQVWLDSLAFSTVIEGSIDGGATVIAGPHLAAAATVPSNIDSGTSALVDAVASFYLARNEMPDFVLLDAALWTTMLKAPATAVLGYLAASIGVPQGDVEAITVRPIPTAKLLQAKQATGTNGSGTNRAIKALAGAKPAVEMYTLPGSPFQAQTVNVANGLINVGVYAYGLAKPASDTITAHLSDGFYGVY